MGENRGMAQRGARLRFDGYIAGLGTSSGTRIVVGHWPVSPYGSFTDVMLERPGGHRILLAPTREIADFVSTTYTFDQVEIVDVLARTGRTWQVDAGPLHVEFRPGRRAPLGWLLRLVPGVLAAAPRWVRLIDRPAALLVRGVRTVGSAGNGRLEFYGARDMHAITAATATWDGADLGLLRPVDPPVTFGFGSSPPAPSLVRITTTVQFPAHV